MERYSSINASNDQYQRSSATWPASRENGAASRVTHYRAGIGTACRTRARLSHGRHEELLSTTRARAPHNPYRCPTEPFEEGGLSSHDEVR